MSVLGDECRGGSLGVFTERCWETKDARDRGCVRFI